MVLDEVNYKELCGQMGFRLVMVPMDGGFYLERIEDETMWYRTDTIHQMMGIVDRLWSDFNE